MIYDGPLYTFFDPHDDKSIVVGTEVDAEGELYVAFHIEGKPVLRNGVFGKRYGGRAGDETAGKRDKRTFMYLKRADILGLYDLLGGILEGESARDAAPHVGSGVDMEAPENAETSISDMLNAMEEDK